MFKLFLLLCLFHFSLGNEKDYKILYEIELPNNENDPNHIKVVNILQEINNTENYTINIIYKSEESFDNSFILYKNNIYEIFECLTIPKDNCIRKILQTTTELYMKYYDNGVFSLCLFTRYLSSPENETEIFRRSICFDQSEYKRFINIISFILNKLEKQN